MILPIRSFIQRLLVAGLTAAVTLGWVGLVSGRAISEFEIAALAFAALLLALLIVRDA